MKKNKLNITYYSFNSLKELSEEYVKLIKSAENAMKRAYAPYSKFSVGTAVLFDDNTIIEGSNQENIAYPSGMCAERVALYYSVSRYPNKIIKAMAIIAKSQKSNVKPEIISPCGACRQVMVEYENRQKSPIKVILADINGNGMLFDNVSHLLPFSFIKL